MKPYLSLIALFVLVPFFVSAQNDTLKNTRLPNAPIKPGEAHNPSDKSKAQLRPLRNEPGNPGQAYYPPDQPKAQLMPLRNEPVGVVAQVPDLVFDNVWTGMLIGSRFITLTNVKGIYRASVDWGIYLRNRGNGEMNDFSIRCYMQFPPSGQSAPQTIQSTNVLSSTGLRVNGIFQQENHSFTFDNITAQQVSRGRPEVWLQIEHNHRLERNNNNATRKLVVTLRY